MCVYIYYIHFFVYKHIKSNFYECFRFVRFRISLFSVGSSLFIFMVLNRCAAAPKNWWSPLLLFMRQINCMTGIYSEMSFLEVKSKAKGESTTQRQVFNDYAILYCDNWHMIQTYEIIIWKYFSQNSTHYL